MIETLATSAFATGFGVVMLVWFFHRAEARRARREAALREFAGRLAGESTLRQFEADTRARISAFEHFAENLLASAPQVENDPQVEKAAVRIPAAAGAIDLPRWAKVAFAARVGRFLLGRFADEDREYLKDLIDIAVAAERAAATGKGSSDVQPPSYLLSLLGLPDPDSPNDPTDAFFRLTHRVFEIIAGAARGIPPRGDDLLLLVAVAGKSLRLSEDLRLLARLSRELQWNDESEVPTGLFPDFFADRLLVTPSIPVGESRVDIPANTIPFPRAAVG